MSESQEAKGELQMLKKARSELMTEREDMLGDLKGHMAEIENVYQLNRELKAKIKRLEAVLYGKNLKGRRYDGLVLFRRLVRTLFDEFMIII